ncbi:hypothetical protein [uncultured Maribacter sp.]|uniref:hypothetical protein n=1 Tax=uncultured Maribacter sp. TaxID=431308 RepID=UPI00262AE190|nr:hypothetical protein [uncultured Maribacter sp.]
MNLPHKLNKNNMMLLFVFISTISSSLCLTSCAKDSDLLIESVLSDETSNIFLEIYDVMISDNSGLEDTDTSSLVEDTPQIAPEPQLDSSNDAEPIVNEPESNDNLAPFKISVGNNIPLIPSNPNRVFYVSVDGKSSNTGLKESSPIDINTAFRKDFVQSGDVFYIKSGEYGGFSSAKGGAHYDLSNLDCNPSRPCYWIGYKDTPGDINASEFSTVSWEDYKKRPQAADGTHQLDASLMPTFSGDTSKAPKYIDNESLFYNDGGEEGFVFRNMQIQYYRRGFSMRNVDSSVFENITVANLGWFSDIEGQGGSNSDLQGTAFLIWGDDYGNAMPQNNVIKNCAAYNMTFRGFTINVSQNTLVANNESTSDIDNGNPQDYYFHTTGKNNLFTNVRAKRLISSNHSGHGICFNQLSNKNIMEKSIVYGTDIHFDGATECYAHDITVTGDNSYGLFKGGAIIVMDGAENNLIENVKSENGAVGVGFLDSGKNPYPEHAGQQNSFKNVSIYNKSHAAIELGWWNDKDDLSQNNFFENCNFTGAPSLFVISRSNSGFSFKNCSLNNILNIVDHSYKNDNGYQLNANTTFEKCTFYNSEVPSSINYIVKN